MPRDKDDLVDIPSLKPASDEVASYRRKQGQYSANSTSDSRRTAKPRQSVVADSAHSSSLKPGVVVLMALLVLVSGWGVYEIVNLKQQLLSTQSQAEDKLQELEGWQSSTNEQMASSGDEVKDKLKFLDGEMRKLWFVANDRNKKAITGIEVSAAKQLKQIEQALAALEKNTGALNQNTKKIESANKKLDGLTGTAAGPALTTLELTEQLRELQTSLAGLQSNLTGRVNTNEQAIEAIDAFRRQANQTMSQLQMTINVLQTDMESQ